jgi:hypothetical protein
MANDDKSAGPSSELLTTNMPKELTVEERSFEKDQASEMTPMELSLGVLSVGGDRTNFMTDLAWPTNASSHRVRTSGA